MYCLTLQSGLSGKVRVYLHNFIYTYTYGLGSLLIVRRDTVKHISPFCPYGMTTANNA